MILWGIFGFGSVAIVARLITGLGATTDLSNNVSWGVWNAIKISIVPLSAGGFVMAAIVYIFGLKRFRPLLRLSILTGFLGYSTFVILLVFDIGLPWRIWHPIIYWQHHSILFEVAWCVMLYLSVLVLEFMPTALEHGLFRHKFFKTTNRFLKAMTIPIVIAGIVLSFLHQASLGSLFLIVPHRLDPLWYSSFIYVLFLISAIGMGLLVIVVEAFLLRFFYHIEMPVKILAPLAWAGAVFMALFFIVRMIDQIVHRVFHGALLLSDMTYLFCMETILVVMLPMLLFLRRIRENPMGLFLCSLSAVLGIVLYRSNVALLAIDWGKMFYFPAWTELALCFAVLSATTLAFLFLIENLDIYGGIHRKATASVKTFFYEPDAHAWLGIPGINTARRNSLIVVTCAALAVAFLPYSAIFGSRPVRTPVLSPKMLKGYVVPRADGFGHQFILSNSANQPPTGVAPTFFLKLDGDRNGRFVLFPHDRHIEKQGGVDSCVKCHHMNIPGDINTSCFECHRDMYSVTDIFNHSSHVDHLGGNDGCATCHVNPSDVKNRQTALKCAECHSDMLVAGSVIKPNRDGLVGYAPGYKRAMHDEFAQQGFCIDCHKEKAAQEGRTPKGKDHALTRCDACHRDYIGEQAKTP